MYLELKLLSYQPRFASFKQGRSLFLNENEITTIVVADLQWYSNDGTCEKRIFVYYIRTIFSLSSSLLGKFI